MNLRIESGGWSTGGQRRHHAGAWYVWSRDRPLVGHIHSLAYSFDGERIRIAHVKMPP